MGRMTEDEKRQNESLNRWINSNETTQDIYRRWESDFAFFLMIFRGRVLEEGTEKYAQMTDAEVEALVKELEEKEKKAEEDAKIALENGSRSIPITVWHYWSERDLINMIRAYAELPASDRVNIMAVRTFLDR